MLMLINYILHTIHVNIKFRSLQNHVQQTLSTEIKDEEVAIFGQFGIASQNL